MTEIEEFEQKYEVTEDTEAVGGGHWYSGSPAGPGKSWHLVVNRALTEDEMAQVQTIIASHRTWDIEDDDYSLVLTWGVLKAIAPDLKILGWYHRPYNILVRGLGTPKKVYEILNATHYASAKEVAKAKYHQDFKPYVGRAATVILEVRKATAKDMKKMVAADD